MKKFHSTLNLSLLYLVVVGLLLALAGPLQTGSFFWGLIGTEVGLILVPALLFLWLTDTPLSVLRWGRLDARLVLVSLLLGAGVWLVGSLLDTLMAVAFGYAILLPANGYPATAGQAALLLLGMAVFAPVCEEILYRGVMLRGLEPYGTRAALVASSLMFVFFHLRLQGLVGLLPVAFLLGYVAWRSGSLLAAMLVHFANNLLAVIVLTYASFNPAHPLPLPSLPGGLVGIGMVAAGLWLLRRRPGPEPYTPVEEKSPRAAGKRPARSGASPLRMGWLALLPLAAVAGIYVYAASQEWISQKQPERLAGGQVVALAALDKSFEGHYRYDITNVVGDSVGQANFQVVAPSGQSLVVGSEKVREFNVQYRGGTWISQGYQKIWTASAGEQGGSSSFEWQFATGEEVYIARSDGQQASIRFADGPEQSQQLAAGALLSEELRMRAMGLPFAQGYARLVDVVQLNPMREQTSLQQERELVYVVGGEPVSTQAGNFIAWKVKLGPNATAWYDRDAPHRMVKYESAGITYLLR